MDTGWTTRRTVPTDGGRVGARERAAVVARALAAAAVLLSAVIHLELWVQGVRILDVLGPAFLLNAIGGLVVAVALLLWRHWAPLVAAMVFGVATLGAFLLSMNVGIFGIEGQVWTTASVLAAVAEVTAVLMAGIALGAERRRR